MYVSAKLAAIALTPQGQHATRSNQCTLQGIPMCNRALVDLAYYMCSHQLCGKHCCACIQRGSMVGQLGAAQHQESPKNHLLFAHPASTGLQGPVNTNAVFLLTSSPQDSMSFLHGQSSPTYLASMPLQVISTVAPCAVHAEPAGSVSLPFCAECKLANASSLWANPACICFHRSCCTAGFCTLPLCQTSTVFQVLHALMTCRDSDQW